MQYRRKILFIFFYIFLIIPQIKADEVKYIILFVGDGMSVASESAASRFLYGQDNKLIWNLFPVKTFVTTWSLSTYKSEYKIDSFDKNNGYDISVAGDKPYPYFFSQQAEKYFEKAEATDSSASATAISTGNKTFNGSVSWCNNQPVKNIVDILNKNNNFNIGILTTALFYDATPAAFSSHNKSRNNYKQIAEEILSKTQPEIIFGCNDYYYLRDFATDNSYYLVDSSDINRPQIFDNAKNKKMFINLNNYSVPKSQNSWNVPDFLYEENSIKFKDIVNLSIKLLLDKKKKFFVMAEQSQIDSANHENNYSKMLASVYELQEGVKSVVDLVNSKKTDMNWNNTLIIVTADHATGFLRFDKKLYKGQLPKKNIILGKEILKRNDSVDYKSTRHTNELVGCYVVGAKSNLFNKYIGNQYKNKNIIDNTDIFKALNEIVSGK
ncbi:MAG: alkaline phosphatase [Endomicrobiaceae bacterium]|nr:alkaline phosphatase [Endomicrobiaceae bacterium]MDD3053521.1 alkaline phosphatase [Endomicrobiaceae bacterium]MDD3922483.1 alkaline phosphatase [Endomicrobiaceae bacterium]